MIARFDALWIFWLAIANVAMWLCWSQALSADVNWEVLTMTLGLVNGTMLGLKEFGREKGLTWLQKKWPRQLLVPATLTPLVIPVIVMAAGFRLGEPTCWLAAVVFAGVLVVTHRYYYHRTPDLFALSCCVASVCVVVTVLAGKPLSEILPGDFVFVLMGGVIIAVVRAAARWLMHIARQFREAGPMSDTELAAAEVNVAAGKTGTAGSNSGV
jgi:hypothetical protein